MKVLHLFVLELYSFIIQNFILSFFIIFVLYILGSIGLMRIAKRLDITYAWIAWLPILNSFLIGKIAYNVIIGSLLLISNILIFINIKALLMFVFLYIAGLGMLSNTGKDFNIFDILSTQNSELPIYILFIVTVITFLTVKTISLYSIYKKLSDEYIIMTIFTVLTFGLLSPIFLFAIRNNRLRS